MGPRGHVIISRAPGTISLETGTTSKDHEITISKVVQGTEDSEILVTMCKGLGTTFKDQEITFQDRDLGTIFPVLATDFLDLEIISRDQKTDFQDRRRLGTSIFKDATFQGNPNLGVEDPTTSRRPEIFRRAIVALLKILDPNMEEVE